MNSDFFGVYESYQGQLTRWHRLDPRNFKIWQARVKDLLMSNGSRRASRRSQTGWVSTSGRR
jgi:hypothetical protein